MTEAPVGPPFRVLTFNLRGGGRSRRLYWRAARPDGAPSFEQIADALLELAPDAVALQEAIDLWIGRDSRGVLEGRLSAGGFAVRFARASAWGIPLVGAGQLSAYRRARFAVQSHRRVKLRPASDWLLLGLPRLFHPVNQRCALRSRLILLAEDGTPARAADGGTVILDLVNLHLNDVAFRREREARHLLAFLEADRGGADHVLLTGDFNDPPESGSPRLLREAGFEDAMAGREEITFGASGNRIVDPGDHGPARIDYVFYTPGNRRGRRTSLRPVGNAQIVLDRVVPSACDDGSLVERHLSDHFGICAGFRIDAVPAP